MEGLTAGAEMKNASPMKSARVQEDLGRTCQALRVSGASRSYTPNLGGTFKRYGSDCTETTFVSEISSDLLNVIRRQQ